MRCGCQPSRAPPPCRAGHDDHRDRALHGCRGAVDAVGQLLARHAAASRAEPGCLQFDAHQGTDNPDESALVERDESQAALAEHRRTPHLRRNVETALVALLTTRSWTVSGPALFGPAL